MKLVGCDCCPSIFPQSDERTEVWIFDVAGDDPYADAPEPTEIKQLCPLCRVALDAMLAPLRKESAKQQPASIPVPDPDVDDQPVPRAQDANQHTCETCGRVGSRRFIETQSGWRCAPSATKCPGNQTEPNLNLVNGNKSAAVAEKPAAVSVLAPGVTAHCQDCTRTWALTGRPLTTAVEMHELKHSHIVNVAEGATA